MQYAPGYFKWDEFKKAAQSLEPRAFKAVYLLVLFTLAILGSIYWVKGVSRVTVVDAPPFLLAFLIFSMPICLLAVTHIVWHRVCDGKIVVWWEQVLTDTFNPKWALFYHHVEKGRPEMSGLAVSIHPWHRARRYQSEAFASNSIEVLVPMSGDWGKIVSKSVVHSAMANWRVRISKVGAEGELLSFEICHRRDSQRFIIYASHLIEALECLHKNLDLGMTIVELMSVARDRNEQHEQATKLADELERIEANRDEWKQRAVKSDDRLDRLRLAVRGVEGIMRGADRCHRHIGFLRSWEAMLDALSDVHRQIDDTSSMSDYEQRLLDVQHKIKELRKKNERGSKRGKKGHEQASSVAS
jgi:hypothetical protein